METFCKNCPKILRIMRVCPKARFSVFSEPRELLIETGAMLISILAEFWFVFICVKFWKNRNFQNLSQILLYGGAQLAALLIKEVIKSPRPVGCCSEGFGMPSNHVTGIAAVFIFWILNNYGISGKKIIAKKAILLIASTIYIILLMKSRVYLNYHSWDQVITGLFFGLFLGICCFIFIRLAKVEFVCKKLKLI